MATDYFADIPIITYKGPDTDYDLAYRYYDNNRIVLGKTMAEHLRFAVCMWHTFCWPGSDVFGPGTFTRPWAAHAHTPEGAAVKREAAFAFIRRLDVPFYCWHDVDVSAHATNVSEYGRYFGEAVDHLDKLQGDSGIKLLWGTANLFSDPRYAAGGATNPDPEVFAWGAMQVRAALEALGREKGYGLVGCCFQGNNAFFVRDDLLGDRFCAPYTAANHYEPVRYQFAWYGGHPAGWGETQQV